MKRISILLLLVFVLYLAGCAQPGTNAPSEPTQPTGVHIPSAPIQPTEKPVEAMWYQNIKMSTYADWSAPVVETDAHFYYIAENGLYQYSKETKENSRVVADTIYGLYLCDGNLYYHTCHKVERIDLRTMTTLTIWDESMLPTDEDKNNYAYIEISDFAIQDGYLYIAGTGISVMRINLANNTMEQFLIDCSDMVLFGNDCYYVDHAERTFSLYHMTCDTKEITLLRGEGYTEPELDKMRIDNIVGMDNMVAYSVRGTADIYLYQPNGSDEKIFYGDDGEQVWLSFIKQRSAGKFYFYITDGSRLKLYEYQPEIGANLLISFDCTTRMCDVVVTETAVFWWSAEDAMTKCFVKV